VAAWCRYVGGVDDAGQPISVDDPLADRLQTLKLPRAVAVICVFVLTFALLGALVLLVFPLAQAQAGALLEALPRYITYVEDNWLPFLSDYMSLDDAGDDVGLASFIERYGSMAGEWGTKVLASLGRSGGAVIAALVSLFLVPILTFYLLRDWDDIMRRVADLIPPSRRETILSLARETDDVLGAFLRGQLLVMLGLATMYTAGLTLIGLPYAIAIGVVAGIVSFVPYLGLFFGIALAGLTALNEPGGLLLLAGVVVVFVVGQMIEGSFLTPKLVGDRIGLHPVIVIFAVMAFGQLFGFFGVLLALPAAAVLSVLVRFAYRNYVMPRQGIGGEEIEGEA
ncbi:MAG: AI-2E family transporter, partial [Pseudomonadota bacterium]